MADVPIEDLKFKPEKESEDIRRCIHRIHTISFLKKMLLWNIKNFDMKYIHLVIAADSLYWWCHLNLFSIVLNPVDILRRLKEAFEIPRIIWSATSR